nr:MAG TPA: hypothetical protein [Caudoviricetes sp.]
MEGSYSDRFIILLYYWFDSNCANAYSLVGKANINIMAKC